ncbi:MAG: histidinol dehydrogenase [Luteibaculum sp.]
MHAKNNIWQFHEAQRLAHQVIETDKEVRCWQRQVPLDSVAIYIPGGSAPLFSTVLMLGVPANAAGVREINLFTPSNKEGSIHPAIAYAAKLVGIKNIYRIGGAQAIAAAALGTEQIPKSFKIFGPGNQYVTAAKMHAQQLGVAIDMPAGPSEVLVWADTLANPAYIAADLLSQAEHGADSQCVLLCDDEDWVNLVEKELEKQLEKLPRKEIAKQALENSFAVVINEDYDEGNSRIAQCQFSNTYAPEHLIVNCSDYDELVPGIRNAGSVFLGPSSPESVGDYASGTNHTLPTAGHAKAYSGVSLSSFCKNITFQELSPLGLNNLAETVITMAEHEGLQAHANAVKIRLNNGN